jgi:L-alanine-DL-glutamate epimerase-like enolase superfamily enzyme
MRQPQCSQRGASAWIAHSKLSKVWVAPYSFPQTSQRAMGRCYEGTCSRPITRRGEDRATPHRPPMHDLDRLLDALRALPLVVDDARVEVGAVALPGYPDGPRPTSTVTLAGGGAVGRGEHVGWTSAEHARFRDALGRLAATGRMRLGAWADAVRTRTEEPYVRAALEAAAIDLALRQSGTNLFRVAGVAARPLRYVVSFDRRDDPLPVARRLVAAAPGVALKLDADEAWPDAVWTALAATGAVAIVDWKGTGTVAAHEHAHHALPDALHEDPRAGDVAWSASFLRRLALDAPVRSAADVGRARPRPAAVNLKPARMGGVLELLAAAAACRTAGVAVYLGGMWETGIGRAQLHALAALLAPDGPNDVAPLAAAAPPPRIVVDGELPGFAA